MNLANSLKLQFGLLYPIVDVRLGGAHRLQESVQGHDSLEDATAVLWLLFREQDTTPADRIRDFIAFQPIEVVEYLLDPLAPVWRFESLDVVIAHAIVIGILVKDLLEILDDLRDCFRKSAEVLYVCVQLAVEALGAVILGHLRPLLLRLAAFFALSRCSILRCRASGFLVLLLLRRILSLGWRRREQQDRGMAALPHLGLLLVELS